MSANPQHYLVTVTIGVHADSLAEAQGQVLTFMDAALEQNNSDLMGAAVAVEVPTKGPLSLPDECYPCEMDMDDEDEEDGAEGAGKDSV